MEFKNLVNSPIFNSSRVVRYAGIHLVEEETLTDHICEISLLCLTLYKDIKSKFPKANIDLGKLLERALVHDLEETITNDIPRPVKYLIPEMKEMMDKVSENYMEVISKQVGVDLLSEWRVCKDKTLEGFIIKTTDMILVARKAYREIALKSNLEMMTVLDEVTIYMNELLNYLVEVEMDDDEEKSVLNYLSDLLSDSISCCLKLYQLKKNCLPDKIDFIDRIR